ncbi:MAG TPA: hypothetical protein VGM98_22335 [Schlesneria sp.]|jgi:hypothetical protein
MNVIPLIGSKLKSDDIVELLEHWDAEVVYDFDRLHENTPDSYYATAHAGGIELHFDATQALVTVYLHVLSSDGFSTFDIEHSDIPSFVSIEEARRFASSRGISTQEGNATFLGTFRNWIKLDYGTRTVHYEYVEGRLNLVTLQRDKADM